MPHVLMVGYGNPLRGDDGLGWAAAEYLAAQPWTEGIEILVEHQLNPELAEIVSQADLAIFIDACWGEQPGQIVVKCVMPNECLPVQSFTHHVDVATLLTYARDLYGHSPEAIMVTVTAQDFGFQQQLSAPVAAALPVLWERIESIVAVSEKV